MRLPFPYTVVGYLDLWEIHPILEHVYGINPENAVASLKKQLRATNQEYRETLEEQEYEPLTVIAVFENYQNDMRRRYASRNLEHNEPAGVSPVRSADL